MAEEKFVVIYTGEDGTRVDFLTESVLVARLNENWWGDVNIMDENQVAHERDTNCWGEALLILKANVVVPKPKETVTTWAL